MELRELQYFLAVVREENISRAAEVLHVTQPTLSRQMAQLEKELGVLLFTRGRHLELTDAGVMLRHQAEEVCALMDRIESQFEEQSEIAGVISIGCGGLKVLQTLLPVIDQFHQRYPKVKFQFHTNSAEYIKERMDQGLLDFGLLLEPIDVTKYDYIRMKQKEVWGLLMQQGHPLATKEYITKEDLPGLPLITSDRLSPQKELEHWLGSPLSTLDIWATYNIITNVATLVDRGMACALTIEGAVNLFGNDRLIFRPLYPEMAMTSVLAWKKFRPNFDAAGKFLEQIKSMQ